MQIIDNIDLKATALRDALQRHLGIKGRSFGHAVRKAGRRLPKRIRTQAALVVQAEAVCGNIKLLRQLDAAEVETAYAEVASHLAGIDRADARRGRILSILAAIAFNLILAFVAWVIWLKMRGTI